MSVNVNQGGSDAFETEVLITVAFDAGPWQGQTFSGTLNGATVIQRDAAKISDSQATIATTMLFMNHSGTLGSLGEVTLTLQPGTTPSGSIVGGWNAQQQELVFPATSSFQNVAVQLKAGDVTVQLSPANVSANIDCIPPPHGTEYNHLTELTILFNGKPIGKATAIHRRDGNGNGNGDGDHRHRAKGPCHEPCCSVQAHGHCTCFHVRDVPPGAPGAPGANEQLVFVASQVGVPASPVGRDRVLAYETITNQGPNNVLVFWDGPVPPPPPAPQPLNPYEQPNQSAVLLPGNSITVVAGHSVKIKYAGPPGGEAHGFDVISWCCPQPWVSVSQG